MEGYVKRFLVLLLALFTFVSIADDGAFKHIKIHKYWRSGLFYFNNTVCSRIVNLTGTNTDVVGMFFDFYDSMYIAEVMVSKNEDNKGRILYPNGSELSCAARVDSKSLFKAVCNLTDDNITFHITFNSGLNREFLDECMQGNTLRIKIDLPDKPIYFNFNLNGFTAALNRALSLTNNDDASYFETPKEPSKSKSDASYFEI